MNVQHTDPTISIYKMARAFCFIAIFILSLILATQGATVSAQIPQLNEQMELEVVPETPLPNDEVTVTARSFATDLDRSIITWSINGVVVEQGPGKKQIVIRAGEIGSRLVVRVSAQTTNLGTLVQEVTIQPTNVDLIWETETYTPPFYKGKALSTSKSMIKIVAMPELIDRSGRKIPSEDLIYYNTLPIGR